MRTVSAETLVPSTTQSVGVIDKSAHPKKGTHSVGVARQWCGRLGKKENCQVGVHLVGVTPVGCAWLDHQLYLTKEWVLDQPCRRKAGVPRAITFRTKPKLTLDLNVGVVAGGTGRVRLVDLRRGPWPR